MIDSCVVLIRKASGHEHSLLGMRAAWSMFAADLEVTVLLMDEGVYSVFGRNTYLNELYTRFLGQGGRVRAVREDLDSRGLDEKSLPPGVAVIPVSEVAPLVREAASTMVF